MERAAIIAGHGPGFCERLAERLAGAGYGVGLFARNEDFLDRSEDALCEAGHDALGVPTDLTDPEQVTRGVEAVRDELGPVEVLAHTASFHEDIDDELDPDRFEKSWRVYTLSGLLCFREVRDDLDRTHGTAVFFGAPDETGGVDYKSAKDATRGLARALAHEYGSDGIHVVHLVVNGSILNPDKYERYDVMREEEHIDPAALADTCLHLVAQDDRARTFELDVQAIGRNMVE